MSIKINGVGRGSKKTSIAQFSNADLKDRLGAAEGQGNNKLAEKIRQEFVRRNSHQILDQFSSAVKKARITNK